MATNNYDGLTPCTIQRTVPNGYLIETRSRVFVADPQDVVRVRYGWAVRTKQKAKCGQIIEK